jgi:hypothetical protein
MSNTAGILRFTRGRMCPVCGGCDRDNRGQGQRCHGYISSDRRTIFCSREEHAGQAHYDPDSATYAHAAQGPCRCGVEHAPAEEESGRNKKDFTIDCVYPYPNAEGKVLFEVVRLRDPKGFRQRRPIGGGQYFYSRTTYECH